MIASLLKRLLILPFLIFGIATLLFFITRLLPGDPTSFYLSPSFPPELAKQMHTQFGLDQSLLVQYLHWIVGVFKGNLGTSFTYHQDVLTIIGKALPYTVALSLLAISAELLLGMVFALISYRSYGTWFDRIFSAGGLIVYSLPTFWLGFILLTVFSVHTHLLPSSHAHSLSADELPVMAFYADLLKHLLLPAATIALPGSFGIARFLRTSLLKISREKFVTVARSMGRSDHSIFYSMILPNALTSVITISGLELGALLTGALITENVFALPGMGRLIVLSIFSRDYPLIVGCTIVAGIAFIGANMVADFVHTVLDPRISTDESANRL